MEIQYHNTDELIDINNVKVDMNLPINERISSYVTQIKNPYYFKVGDVKVRLTYAKTDITLNDCICRLIECV